MKSLVLIAATLGVSLSAMAANPKVQKAAASLKANDTRTVTKIIENTDGNPCLPEGKSYQVDLQVKQAAFNPDRSKVVYKWETVKTINVDKDGNVMEVCAE